MNIKKRIISGFLFILLLAYSKRIYADDGIRNPGLLAISIPVITTMVAVIVTSVFISDEKPKTEMKASTIDPIESAQMRAKLSHYKEESINID